MRRNTYIVGSVLLAALIGTTVAMGLSRDSDTDRTGGAAPATACPDPALTADVVPFEHIEQVTPPGSIIGESFKAHSYVNFSGPETEIRAPLPTTLTQGAKYRQSGKTQYLLEFASDCGLRIWFDHVSEPVDSIASQLSGPPSDDSGTERLEPVSFAAGETIGRTDGNGVQRQFDFGLYDLEHENDYTGTKFEPYLVPGSEKYEHAVCPYDYYTTKKRTAYYALFDTTNDEPYSTFFCKQR